MLEWLDIYIKIQWDHSVHQWDHSALQWDHIFVVTLGIHVLAAWYVSTELHVHVCTCIIPNHMRIWACSGQCHTILIKRYLYPDWNPIHPVRIPIGPYQDTLGWWCISDLNHQILVHIYCYLWQPHEQTFTLYVVHVYFNMTYSTQTFQNVPCDVVLLLLNTQCHLKTSSYFTQMLNCSKFMS